MSTGHTHVPSNGVVMFPLDAAANSIMHITHEGRRDFGESVPCTKLRSASRSHKMHKFDPPDPHAEITFEFQQCELILSVNH